MATSGHCGDAIRVAVEESDSWAELDAMVRFAQQAENVHPSAIPLTCRALLDTLISYYA